MKYFITAAALTAAVLSGTAAGAAVPETMDINDGGTLLFDFGAVPEYGWTPVDAKIKYDPGRGYGFSMISFSENESCSGSGVLSDAVNIDRLYCDRVSFDVDLPPGIYELSVYSGNIQYMTVCLEGQPAIIDLEFSSTEGRIEIPVTDGQLNMSFMRGSSGTELSVSALSITRKSGPDERRKRVFVCGDSLAATFYPQFVSQPLETGYRGGWGQMLGAFLPEDLYVHNMSSVGQTAKGFIESGQLESLLYFAEPGDYAVISFGYNDYLSCTAEEYTENLTAIVSALKSAGCVPIISSELCEADEFDKNGAYTKKDDRYEAEAIAVADGSGVQYIDLHAAPARYLSSMGYDSAMTLFWLQWDSSIDTLHPNRNGAGQAARIFTEECIKNGIDEFSGILTGYGISEDIRIKCRLDGNTMYLENTAPNEITLQLITNKYRSKTLSDSIITSITLPAYDVIEPQPETEVYVPMYVRTNRSFLMGSGIAIELKQTINL